MHPPHQPEGKRNTRTTTKKQKGKHLQPKLITQRLGHAPFSSRPVWGTKNTHKQSGCSGSGGGDRGRPAKWFKTQLKF